MLQRFLAAAAFAVVAAAAHATAIRASDEATADVRAGLESLIRNSGADVAIAYRTLDRRDALFIRADVDYHAASTMKVPVLVELFRQGRAGLLSLDDQIPIRNEFHSIVDGSVFQLDTGDASDATVVRNLGGRMSYRALAEEMITVSSNFATNLVIERLGPKNVQAATNALGADGMHVVRGVEDNKAFEQGMNNTTTARALLTLLEAIATGRAVDRRASDEMVAILKRQKFNDRIPAGLPAGVPVAHKTGEITRIQHDAAIVYGPRPFVLVVLIRGLEEAKKGAGLAPAVARMLYQAANTSH
jgi:beta-lactamase class A